MALESCALMVLGAVRLKNGVHSAGIDVTLAPLISAEDEDAPLQPLPTPVRRSSLLDCLGEDNFNMAAEEPR